MQATELHPFDFDDRTLLKSLQSQLDLAGDWKRISQSDKGNSWAHSEFPLWLTLTNDKKTKRLNKIVAGFRDGSTGDGSEAASLLRMTAFFLRLISPGMTEDEEVEVKLAIMGNMEPWIEEIGPKFAANNLDYDPYKNSTISHGVSYKFEYYQPIGSILTIQRTD